ncbi:hypothetical protein AX17_005309 [Amanita inopinata Kibby_2008]|nr:hypothetical protein AX17_005309 [Amanita inopinata Kibby_2008]
MQQIPRSRKPSVAGSISTASRPSPSHLSVSPALRPSASLSNLHIHGQNVGMAVPTVTQESLESSASSVIDVDMNEGILIRDSDQKEEPIETDDVTVTGHVEQPGFSEENKKNLRDQLRRTLSQSKSVTTSPRSQTTVLSSAREITAETVPLYQPRSYFVLTDAGKPVFVRAEEKDVDNTTSVVGVMQALMSVFLDDKDKLRYINAGRTRITFMMRPPLYYVCVSSWGEPESVTKSHLEYLHLQILSIVTAGQLRRIFERRTNFDLRRLLSGAETFLISLLDRMEFDLAMSTSSLHCLKLEPTLRKRVAEVLVPHSKIKDILYVILVACGQVITLIRPKKHSIHPADIHIILNTVHSPSIINSPASASWIPVCLPKYNSQTFVNAYISFLRREDHQGSHDLPPILMQDSGAPEVTQGLGPEVRKSLAVDGGLTSSSNVVLVCISGSGDMDVTRGWCDTVAQVLENDGLTEEIMDACRSRSTVYSVSDLGIPGLRHFVYKSRAHVQITMPVFEDPYDDISARRRLVTFYQVLHDAIHAKSGQEGTLKLQYLRTEKESVMGWITQPFEVYLSLSHWLPKSAAINAANAVARWVKKEETRLFLRDAPVF